MCKINSRYIAYVLLLLSSVAAPRLAAQRLLSPDDRSKWLSEIREYKHDFIARELKLSAEQKREFMPLYDEMEDAVERINSETRALEAKVSDNAEASDLELENASRTIFEQKRAEGQVEMTYFDKFKDILTPRQLLRLKNTERRFTQQLMKQHGRVRGRQK